jgi:ribokinase
VSVSITVVGSLNMDFVVRVAALPRPGETVAGHGFATIPGGKGANQACAAGKLGGRARMVGRVGEDVFGAQLLESLRAAGVDTAGVRVTEATPTGVALIFVEEGGRNEIVVASGANACLTPEDVKREIRGSAGDLLLLQLESPLETVEAAAALGAARGMKVVLDPAPARILPDALLGHVDCLTPNESEALLLLGRAAGEVTLAEAPQVAAALRRRGVRSVILKLADKGAFFDDGKDARHFPAPKVEAIDSTAAGDTFNGALAVALAEHRDVADAIAFANAAAALSVTRLGAQASIPTRAEVAAAPARPPGEGREQR